MPINKHGVNMKICVAVTAQETDRAEYEIKLLISKSYIFFLALLKRVVRIFLFKTNLQLLKVTTHIN